MIVLDEHLHGRSIMSAISTWFPGQVIPNSNFCIVTIALTQDEIDSVPQLLRRLFRLPEFKTKASRMGKVIHVTHSHIEYYESDRRVHSLQWQD